MSTRLKAGIDVTLHDHEGHFNVKGKHIDFNGHRGYLDAVLKAMEIHTAKNTDYSGGGGPDDDSLANFKGAVELGIDPGLGIILRMQDKFQRIKAFAKTGKLAVADEGVEDAMTDIANYAFLYLALKSESESKDDD